MVVKGRLLELSSHLIVKVRLLSIFLVHHLVKLRILKSNFLNDTFKSSLGTDDLTHGKHPLHPLDK